MAKTRADKIVELTNQRADGFVPAYRRTVRTTLLRQYQKAANLIRDGYANPIPWGANQNWAEQLAATQTNPLMRIAYDGTQMGALQLGQKSIDEYMVETKKTRGLSWPVKDKFLLPGTRQAVDEYLRFTSNLETSTSIKRIKRIFDAASTERVMVYDAAGNAVIDPATGLQAWRGMTNNEIADLLEHYGLADTAWRANLIARTCSVWGMNEGAQQRYEAMGVPVKRWSTTMDDIACPFCRHMDGIMIPTKADFFPPGEQLKVQDGKGENAKIRKLRVHEGMSIKHPPLHPHCLLPGHTIQGSVIGSLSGHYEGDAIEVFTVNGARLSMTVNHRVLSKNALIYAGDLRKGDELIGYKTEVEPSPVNIDENNEPILIENVADALSTTGANVPSGCFDLNGDEEFFTSEIYVKAANTGFIESQINETKRILNVALMSSGDRCMSFGRLSNALLSVHPSPFNSLCLRLIADMDPRIFKTQSDDLTINIERLCYAILRLTSNIPLANLVDGQCDLSAESNCFGSASKCNTLLYEPTSEGFTFNANFFTETKARFTRNVSLDVVAHVRRFHYSGPVYDIETVNGYYTAGVGNNQHVFVKNCRCGIKPIVDRRQVEKYERQDRERAASG